jgi:site-specific recombinase XerD
MLTIPSLLRTQFREYLWDKTVPPNTQAAYLKWLRYYLDFCQKYHFPQEHRDSLPHFLKKLQEKRQTQAQQEQAAHAIARYYELRNVKTSVSSPHTSSTGTEHVSQEGKSTLPPPRQCC